MFEVKLMVDDKKLGKALHAVEGLATIYGITPVRNAMLQNGKVTTAGEPSTAIEALHRLIGLKSKRKDIELTTAEAMNYAATVGYQKGAMAAALKAAVKDKSIKRQSRGHYTIVATN